MIFTQQIRDLAIQFNLKPIEIKGFETIFDQIARFAFVKDQNHLNEIIIESYQWENGNQFYKYDEIPTPLKNTIKKYIGKGLTVGSFFSDLKKTENLEKFIRDMIRHKIQPRDFYFDGLITYREIKHEPMIDNTKVQATYKSYSQKQPYKI